MAIEVYCHRQACYMGGMYFDMDSQSSSCTAKTLWANSQFIDFFKQLLFQIGNIRVFASLTNFSEQRQLGQQGAFFKSTADTHSYNNWWARVGAG